MVVVCLRVMKRPAKTSAGIACSTGLCVFFSGIVVSLLFHASGAEVIGYTMTAALTGCASYFRTLTPAALAGCGTLASFASSIFISFSLVGASVIFSMIVLCGNRLKCWNTIPMC